LGARRANVAYRSAACSGDDQRGARLVDQDVVDLVDDGEVVVARAAVVGLLAAAVLDLLGERLGHVVAQVVKAELRVGAVRDVGRVGRRLLLGRLHRLQDADRHAEQVVDRLHPHRVTAGEVVVDGDDVDTPTGQAVEHDRERPGERFALAGLHLGDRAVVEHHAADQLHVEVAHSHRAPAGLADEREAFRKHLVQRLARARALAQLVGGLAQLSVFVEANLLFEAVDAGDTLLVRPELLRLAHPKRAVQKGHAESVARGRSRDGARGTQDVATRERSRAPVRRPARSRGSGRVPHAACAA
jgi:hypothetical protein